RNTVKVSFLISIGVPLMPGPGAGDDLVQVIMLGLPAKLALDFFGGGNQNSRITRSARTFDHRDTMPRYLAGGLDHFTDRVTVAAPQVIDQLLTLLEPFKCQQMGR